MDQGPTRHSQSRVLELDALFSSVFVAYLGSRSTSYRPYLQPLEYRLAAFDVLANFLRLSEFQSHVNPFFCLFEIFFLSQNQTCKMTSFAQHKISKHRNDRKVAAEHSAPGTSKSTAVAWVWMPAGPWALNRDQTLGLRSVFPLQSAPILPEPRCEACFATHLEYRAFHFRASRTPLCDFLRVSATNASCNLFPVNN